MDEGTMTRSVSFRRLGYSIGVLTCSLFSGCMAGWAYPTLAHVDSVNPGSINDIHAFRVDVIQNTGEFKVPTCRDEHTLSCIPLSGQGPVPAQFAVYFDYGVV